MDNSISPDSSQPTADSFMQPAPVPSPTHPPFPTKIIIAIAAVLVIGGMVAGSILLFGNGNSDDNDGGSQDANSQQDNPSAAEAWGHSRSDVFYDGKIYYGNSNGIYSIDVTTRAEKQISTDKVSYLSVQAGRIYYGMYGDNAGTYSVALDGSDKKKLDASNIVAAYLQVYKDKIYYIGRQSGPLYSMDMDGGNIKELFAGNTNGFDISDDKIYYVNGWGTNTLFSMNLDGSDQQELMTFDGDIITKSRIVGDGFQIVGDYIIYRDLTIGLADEHNDVWVAQLDGGNKRSLGFEANDVFVSGSEIYYSDLNDYHRIYSIRTDGSSKKRLTDFGGNGIVAIGGGTIYFNHSIAYDEDASDAYENGLYVYDMLKVTLLSGK